MIKLGFRKLGFGRIRKLGLSKKAWTFNLGPGDTVVRDANNNLTKTTGVSGWSGYFWSSETLVNGRVDITLEEAGGDDGFFGFTDLAAVTGYGDLAGFWINGAGTLQMNNKGAISGAAAFVAGDTLSVLKAAGAYTVLKNGAATGLSFNGPAGAVRLGGIKGRPGAGARWLATSFLT